jgi:hypothetical protein
MPSEPTNHLWEWNNNWVQAWKSYLYQVCDTAGRPDAATSWPFDTFFHFGSYFCINQTKILYLGSVLRDVKLTPLCDTHSSVSSMSPFGSSCHGPDHHLCSLWSGKNPELNNFWSGRAERGNWWGLGGLLGTHLSSLIKVFMHVPRDSPQPAWTPPGSSTTLVQFF